MAFSLSDFATALLTAGPLIEAAQHEMLELQCEAIEARAKSYIGNYNHPGNWAQLAQATQEDRVRRGFAANEPLLRTGDLRDSIMHAVVHNVGYVFSNSAIARYQELGTVSIPPRPFLSTAAMEMEQTCLNIAGKGTAALLWSALMKAPVRTLRGLTHIGQILPDGQGVTQVVR